MKKFLKTICCAMFIAVSTLAPLNAESEDNIENGGTFTYNENTISPRGTEEVGGGKWTHSIAEGNIKNKYFHKSKPHTVTSCNTRCHQSTKEPAGFTASKNIVTTLMGNKVYWNTYK